MSDMIQIAWDYIYSLWFHLFKKEKALTTGSKSDGVEPNWYPPAPTPPVSIDAELVFSEEEIENQRLACVFKDTLFAEVAKNIQAEKEALKKINFDLGIRNTIKYAISHPGDTCLIRAEKIGIEDAALPHFIEVFKALCAPYGIKVTQYSTYLSIENNSFIKAIDNLLISERKDLIDDTMRKQLQPGPYR